MKESVDGNINIHIIIMEIQTIMWIDGSCMLLTFLAIWLSNPRIRLKCKSWNVEYLIRESVSGWNVFDV